MHNVSETLNIGKIKERIKIEDYKNKIILYDTIPSTNDKAKELGNSGADAGTVIIAERQTSGRGRFGRSFYSPYKKGIYMSIILRPSDFDCRNPFFVLASSTVIVADILNDIVKDKVSIKWMNDILIDKKKVCGILVESSVNTSNPEFNFLVVGIGINVYTKYEDFPREIADNITSLYQNIDLKLPFLREMIIGDIISSFSFFTFKKAKSYYIPRYKEFSNMLGNKISVYNKEKKQTQDFLILDINDQGKIVARDDENNMKTINPEILF